MKRVKKPKSKQKHIVSDKQLQKVKEKVTEDVTKKALLLFLAAAADEMELSDEQVCKIFERANRYAEYIDTHLVKIKQVQEVVEKGTGVQMGWW